MVNLELYKIFKEVAENGSITKASINLNISQPAVTKHIHNLENELGGPVFIRTSNGVKLNENGEVIYKYIKQALSLIEQAESKFNEMENLERGTIRIGISTTLTKKYLFKYIEIFHKLYPNIIVEISTDPTSILISELKKGMIDFIVAKIPKTRDRELIYEILGQMHDIFVVNNKYQELINKRLTFSDICKYPLLVQKYPSNSRKTFDNYIGENEVNALMNIASTNLIIDFVKVGYGIGFITKEYIEEELENKTLFELDINPKLSPCDFGIMKLKNNLMTFSAEKFIEILVY
jgi:DNA-binding transcriptional LysR family regulator